MRRNRLLLAVATAALIAGTGGTLAQQDVNKQKSAPSAQSQPSGGAQQNRDLQRGQARQQRGSEQHGLAGQQDRRETTGQAPGSERGNQSSEDRKTGQAGEKRGQSSTAGQNERGQ